MPDRSWSTTGPRAGRGRGSRRDQPPSRSSPGARRGPARPRTASREPSLMPCRADPAGGVTAETSEARERSEKPSRQPCTREIASDGRPSTVTPLSPSACAGAGSKPEHGDGVGSARDGGVPVERRRVEHGNERSQVLADDEVERDRERGLVGLGVDERGAVALGEQRQREGEGEEGHGHGGGAGAATERDGGEAGANAAVDETAGKAHERPEQARRGDGGGERDQARQERAGRVPRPRPRRAVTRRRRRRRERRRRPRAPRARPRRAGRSGSLPAPGRTWRRR